MSTLLDFRIWRMLGSNFLRLSSSSAAHAGLQGMEVHRVVFTATLAIFHDLQQFRTHYSIFLNHEDGFLARAKQPAASYPLIHKHHPGSLCIAGACRDNSTLCSMETSSCGGGGTRYSGKLQTSQEPPTHARIFTNDNPLGKKLPSNHRRFRNSASAA